MSTPTPEPQYGPTPEQLLRELRRRRYEVLCLIAVSQREIDYIDAKIAELKKQADSVGGQP